MENTRLPRNEIPFKHCSALLYNAREEAGRPGPDERRGEGVPKIIKASEAR